MIAAWRRDSWNFIANPSCDASQEPYNRRSLQDARKRNTGAHQATRHFRRLLAHLSHHNDETNESIATRASGGVSDPTTLSRIVDVLYPLLAALYVNNGNPNIGADQLAESEAFGNASANLWGGVSLQAWSSRLHYTQQDNYASDGPPDPRGDVLDMICEGPDSNAITLAMLVLENSVCLPSTCDATPSVCSGNPARRELEVSTDENEGGNVDDKLFKRTFDQVGIVCLIEFTHSLIASPEIHRSWSRGEWRKANFVHSNQQHYSKQPSPSRI